MPAELHRLNSLANSLGCAGAGKTYSGSSETWWIPQLAVAILQQWLKPSVSELLGNLRKPLAADVERAKLELAKHVTEIRIVPQMLEKKATM